MYILDYTGTWTLSATDLLNKASSVLYGAGVPSSNILQRVVCAVGFQACGTLWNEQEGFEGLIA